MHVGAIEKKRCQCVAISDEEGGIGSTDRHQAREGGDAQRGKGRIHQEGKPFSKIDTLRHTNDRQRLETNVLVNVVTFNEVA